MTKSALQPEETHLIFQSGESWYAVPAEAIIEIVDLPALRALPGAPTHIRGIFVHRAEVIPAVDLAILLGQPASTGNRVVLVRAKGEQFGIIAKEVAGMSGILGESRPIGSAGIKLHLMGPARASDRTVVVMDVAGLGEFLSRR